MEKTIDVKIPQGFRNCGVSISNRFIADTNDSANWDTISLRLPEPPGTPWSIHSYDTSVKSTTVVKLISYL